MLGKFSMNEVYCTKPVDLELKVLSHGKIKKNVVLEALIFLLVWPH